MLSEMPSHEVPISIDQVATNPLSRMPSLELMQLNVAQDGVDQAYDKVTSTEQGGKLERWQKARDLFKAQIEAQMTKNGGEYKPSKDLVDDAFKSAKEIYNSRMMYNPFTKMDKQKKLKELYEAIPKLSIEGTRISLVHTEKFNRRYEISINDVNPSSWEDNHIQKIAPGDHSNYVSVDVYVKYGEKTSSTPPYMGSVDAKNGVIIIDRTAKNQDESMWRSLTIRAQDKAVKNEQPLPFSKICREMLKAAATAQNRDSYTFSKVIFNGIEHEPTLEALPPEIKPGENKIMPYEELSANEQLKKAPHVKALLGFLKEYPDMEVASLEIQKANDDFLDHIIMNFKSRE